MSFTLTTYPEIRSKFDSFNGISRQAIDDRIKYDPRVVDEYAVYALQDHEIIGSLGICVEKIRLFTPKILPLGFLHSFWLADCPSSSDIALKLIQFAEDYYRRRNINLVLSSVTDPSSQIEFYRKFGYEEVLSFPRLEKKISEKEDFQDRIADFRENSITKERFFDFSIVFGPKLGYGGFTLRPQHFLRVGEVWGKYSSSNLSILYQEDDPLVVYHIRKNDSSIVEIDELHLVEDQPNEALNILICHLNQKFSGKTVILDLISDDSLFKIIKTAGFHQVHGKNSELLIGKILNKETTDTWDEILHANRGFLFHAYNNIGDPLEESDILRKKD